MHDDESKLHTSSEATVVACYLPYSYVTVVVGRIRLKRTTRWVGTYGGVGADEGDDDNGGSVAKPNTITPSHQKSKFAGSKRRFLDGR